MKRSETNSKTQTSPNWKNYRHIYDEELYEAISL